MRKQDKTDADASEWESHPDDGRVWTSYSDLFVTISVIFLVMFVFSSLRASLESFHSQIQKEESHKYLAGKLSKSQQNKFNQDLKLIETNSNEISNSFKTINKKQEALLVVSKNLKSYQRKMNQIISEQKRREGLIAHLRDENELNKKLIEKTKQTIRKQEVAAQTHQVKTRSLQVQISRYEEKISNLEEKLSTQSARHSDQYSELKKNTTKSHQKIESWQPKATNALQRKKYQNKTASCSRLTQQTETSLS